MKVPPTEAAPNLHCNVDVFANDVLFDARSFQSLRSLMIGGWLMVDVVAQDLAHRTR